MRKILSLLFCCMLLTAATYAQESRDTIHASSQVTGRVNMVSVLNLSREQAKKMKEMNRDFREKREAITNDSTLDENTRRQKEHALMKERRQKMMAILTPEQQKKLREYRKEHPHKPGEGKAGKGS